MGSGRRRVPGGPPRRAARGVVRGTVLACCAALVPLLASCGGGGGEKARLVTTPLPMQPSGLLVGGDVQPKATDVVRTAVTEAQLRRIVAACRDAVEITDVSQDACSRSVRERFGRQRPCVRSEPCMKGWFRPPGTVRAGAPEPGGGPPRGSGAGGQVKGVVWVTSPTLCRSPAGDVCMSVGVPEARVFGAIIGSATPSPPAGAPGGTPGTPAETPGTPGTPGAPPESSAGPATEPATPDEPEQTGGSERPGPSGEDGRTAGPQSQGGNPGTGTR